VAYADREEHSLATPSLSLARRQEVLAALRRAAASGLSLDRALEIAAAEVRAPAARAAVSQLRTGIVNGRNLAAQEEVLTGLFGPACTALLIAGERAGDLDGMLGRAEALVTATRALRRRFAMGLAYPALVTLAALVLLPLPILVSQGFGAAFTGYWLPAGIAAAVLFAVGVVLRITWNAGGPARRTMEYSILRLPVIGGLRRAVVGRGFYEVLGALLHSGVSAAAALPDAARAAGSQGMTLAATGWSRRISDGTKLTVVLKDAPDLEEIDIRQLEVAEEIGDLPQLCRVLATRNADAAATRGTVLAGVVAAVVTGTVLLAVAASVIQFWSSYFDQINELSR
jgi:type II secretory pathway component PulF